ncbi:kinase-like domain-containing protein [Rhizophagus clarus]|uniref:Kinase-like domain-containing protein n=1 Tax=Rhizophagus clarus TaxID=94130 RepID=A0A8H3LBD4_9GLOM|nr:kinase-like domain-containing protein [Rhizophagus clarus]
MSSQNRELTKYNILEYLKNNFKIWTSGNEKIDKFIQERQLKIDEYDTIIEWISYNQLDKIKETVKNGHITVYSAIWKDGPLYYDNLCEKYTRNSNKEVALKYFYNSQNSIDSLINELKIGSHNDIIFKRIPYNQYDEIKEIESLQNPDSELLNEVKAYIINNDGGILMTYEISQNSDTKNYIIVLQYAAG